MLFQASLRLRPLLRAIALVLPDARFLHWAAPEALLFGGYVAWQSNASFILQEHYIGSHGIA